MSINAKLAERNQNLCELCSVENSAIEFTVSPKSDDNIDHQVAICQACLDAMGADNNAFHWRCLEGSIWSMEPGVQALSYRLLQKYKNEGWANNLISSIELDEAVLDWAMSALQIQEVHKDAFGNVLENGDNVVLTKALDVKGTNFTASKGMVVKRIRLIQGNPEQIEGKINEQSIVILTKYTKKN
jgi:protein PhnA